MSFMLYFMGFIGVGIFVFMLVMMLKERFKEIEPRDDTLVSCFMSQYSGGFHRGTLQHWTKGDKRDGITFLPKDIDYLRRLKSDKKIEIKPVTIFVKKNLIFQFPRGTLSTERNEIWLLPPKPEDLPKHLQESIPGKRLMQMVSNENIEEGIIEILRKEGKVKDKLLNKVDGGDMFREYLDLDDELKKEFAKKVLDIMSERRGLSTGTSGFPPSKPSF